MSEKKNLVVIGYGGMGGGFHCTHAQKSDVVSLAGIYDIDPEKRAKAEANGIKAYPTLEAVLEDKGVDLGKLETTVKYVRKGRVSIEEAAQDLNMTVEEFTEKMNQIPATAV